MDANDSLYSGDGQEVIRFRRSNLVRRLKSQGD